MANNTSKRGFTLMDENKQRASTSKGSQSSRGGNKRGRKSQSSE